VPILCLRTRIRVPSRLKSPGEAGRALLGSPGRRSLRSVGRSGRSRAQQRVASGAPTSQPEMGRRFCGCGEAGKVPAPGSPVDGTAVTAGGGGSAFTGKTRSTCPILRLRARIALPLEARVEPSAGILRPMTQEWCRHLNGPEGRSARTLRTVVQELCCRRAKAARAVGGTAAPGRRRSRRQRPLDRPTRTAARFRRQRFGLLTISRSCSGTQVKVPYTAPRGSRPVLNGVPQRSMSPILVPCRNSSRRRSSWT